MQIDFKNVSKSYTADKYALNGINLHIQSPCLLGLVGPNGAGKSTLMKLMTAQLKETFGLIMVDQTEMSKAEKKLRSRLGYLPQDFGLYDELTIYQFLDYIASLKGFRKNVKNIIGKSLEETNLDGIRNSRISTLSGGQKQRVGIAQAIMGEPDLMIVDEPTVGLDPEERIKFRNMFSKYSRDKTVILSTHIIDDIQSICNRIVVMDNGAILFDGEPDTLIQEAEGHVGVFETDCADVTVGSGLSVTSRLLHTKGTTFRVVGNALPEYCVSIAPTLEDAYIYRRMKWGVEANGF
jgi:ABC-2 type transport system ATP-binding protein